MVQPLSMGNERTVNSWCGKDPFSAIVHNNDPGFHYPGCGLTMDQCTTLPCCGDAQVNSKQLELYRGMDFGTGPVMGLLGTTFFSVRLQCQIQCRLQIASTTLPNAS